MLSHHDYTSNLFNPSQGVRLFPISLSASIVSWHRHNLILCGFSAGHKCKPQVLARWRTGEGAGGTLACRWCCGLFLSSPSTEEASSTDSLLHYSERILNIFFKKKTSTRKSTCLLCLLTTLHHTAVTL